MTKQGFIELLAPAKDLKCAMEAILHGADAIYIGAPKFGARSSAGNSLEDLAKLVQFAHPFRVRIYVTLNVLLFDEELSEVEDLIWELWKIGIDALIIQDMAILQMNLPPIPLHASTQTDNRTVQKVRFLEDAGFKQVVLSRELSLDQIREISDSTNVPLECFVHGSLCVSYSGQCYLSHAMCGRSANRGECAQYCRLPYDLVDADGKVLIRQKHILSLKDLNRSEYLQDLIDAGVRSFKIEGRLKDLSYVKNVTAWYRQKLDQILEKRTDLKRSSSGYSRLTFTPDPQKSFNRGFTDYFMKNRPEKPTNPDTPKSMGESVGRVKEIRGNCLSVAGIASFSNGDGLSFFNERGILDGFRVNRVEDNRLFPTQMPRLNPNTPLFRTFDQSFERVLEKSSAERFIPVFIKCWEIESGFKLNMVDQEGHNAEIEMEIAKEPASKPQKEQVKAQLTKLGNTYFEAISCEIDWTNEWFVPVSKWADVRRQLCTMLEEIRATNYKREEFTIQPTTHPYPEQSLSYLGNILNEKAADFYKSHGVISMEPGFETRKIVKDVRFALPTEPLMFNKFCIRFELGDCPKQGKSTQSIHEPLFLLYNSNRFQLSFDCKACEMHVSLPE